MSLKKSDLIVEQNHPRWDSLMGKELTDESTRSYDWVEFTDANVNEGILNGTELLTFRIPKSSEYVDLRESYLQCVFTQTATGAAGGLLKGALFPKLNAFCLFSKLSLYIDGHLIEEINDCDIVAHVRTMLMDYDAKREQNGLFLQFYGEYGLPTGGIVNKAVTHTVYEDGANYVNNFDGIDAEFSTRFVQYCATAGYNPDGTIANGAVNTIVYPVLLPLKVIFKSLDALSVLAGVNIDIEAQCNFNTLTTGFVNVAITNQNKYALQVDRMRLCAYKCRPTSSTELELLNFLNTKQPKVFTYDGISVFSSLGARNWNIATLTSRPKYVLIYHHLTVQTVATTKNSVRNTLTRAELKYNNISVPKRPYGNLANEKERKRVYYELLRMFGKTNESSYPISFRDYELNYFVLAYDLSQMDPSIFQRGDGRLVLETDGTSATYRFVAIVLSERAISLGGEGNSREDTKVQAVEGV